MELTNTQETDLARGQPVNVVIDGTACVLISRTAFDQIKDDADAGRELETNTNQFPGESHPADGPNGNGRSHDGTASLKESDFLVGLSETELQALATGKLAPPEQERLSDLLHRNKNGQLSADDEAELDEFLERIDSLNLLKARAILTLKKHAGALDE